MDVLLSIPDDVAAKLCQEAARTGEPLPTYAADLLVRSVRANSTPAPLAPDGWRRFRAVGERLARTNGRNSLTDAVSEMRR